MGTGICDNEHLQPVNIHPTGTFPMEGALHTICYSETQRAKDSLIQI